MMARATCRLATSTLTDRGGNAWEEAASPEWSRFVDCQGEDPDDDTATVLRAANEQEAEKYLAYLRYSQMRVLGDIERVVLRPFQATYWKELPEGIEFRFRSEGDYSHPERIGTTEFGRAEPHLVHAPLVR